AATWCSATRRSGTSSERRRYSADSPRIWPSASVCRIATSRRRGRGCTSRGPTSRPSACVPLSDASSGRPTTRGPAPTTSRCSATAIGSPSSGVILESWAARCRSMHRDAQTPVLMLFSVTGIVLLIACANIANLLLARGAGRAMEMGVRLALGASRRQVMIQLLTESVLLAFLGALAGLLVTTWTLTSIAALAPPEVRDTLRFGLEPAVLVFAAVLALATGIVFGMFPAWHSTRTELVTAIRANAGQISGARSAARFRAALVTAQLALATTLLIAAGLFLKSLVNVTRVDLGVHVVDVVTFSIAPERSGYDSARALLLYGRVEDEVGAIPGVSGVTRSMVPLLSGGEWRTDVHVQGFPSGPGMDINAAY